MKIRKIVALIIVAALVFSGCSQQTEQKEKPTTSGSNKESKTESNSNQVIIALEPDYETFDPGRAYEIFAAPVLNGLYDNLLRFIDSTEVPEPYLAKSYEVSKDGKTFTFKLRDDVKFSSGNKMTSKDVKWSLDRLKNLKGNPSFMAEDIEKIETPDDYTVNIILSKPDAAFAFKLTGFPFGILDSKTVIANGGIADENASLNDSAEQWLTQNSAGSGPFILEKYTPNVEVVLKRNDNYWNGPAKVEKVIFKDMPDSNTQALMVQKGDIDVAFSLNSDQMKQLEGNSKLNILSSNTFAMLFLFMNTDEKIGGPMSNPDVQKAVRYALDYKGMQSMCGEGTITPQTIIQVGFLGALPPRDPNYTNIEKAKELLKKAGYPDGFTIEFNAITHATEGIKWLNMAQKVKEDLSKVGINAEIRTMDTTVGYEEYRNARQGFSIMVWGPDYMDVNNQLAFLPGQLVGLRVNWKAEDNPELVKLGDEALIENNVEKRAAIIKKIQEKMADDSPFIPLVQVPKKIAVKKGLKGAEYTEAYKIDVYKLSWD